MRAFLEIYFLVLFSNPVLGDSKVSFKDFPPIHLSVTPKNCVVVIYKVSHESFINNGYDVVKRDRNDCIPWLYTQGILVPKGGYAILYPEYGIIVACTTPENQELIRVWLDQDMRSHMMLKSNKP